MLTDSCPKRLRMIWGLCNHHAVVGIPYTKWTERGAYFTGEKLLGIMNAGQGQAGKLNPNKERAKPE